MFSDIITTKTKNIKKFIESFAENNEFVTNYLLKLNSDKITSNQSDKDFANGQTFDLLILGVNFIIFFKKISNKQNNKIFRRIFKVIIILIITRKKLMR